MQIHRKQAREPIPENPIRKRLLNVDEAALYLGIKVDTLRKKSRLRELPYVKVGGSVRFDMRALDLFIEKNTIQVVE